MTKAIESGLRIDAEYAQRLACVVFVDLEVPPGEAGDQVPLGVLHRDRHFDKIYLDDKAGQCPAAGFGRDGLRVNLGLGRRAAGSKAAGGCSGWGWPVAEEELGPEGVPVAPIPGVTGPSTLPSEGGGCGVGASGTDCCFWASAPRLKTSPELRSAASAMALLPFTAIRSPSGLFDTAKTSRQSGRHLTEYQTRQSAQVACQAGIGFGRMLS